MERRDRQETVRKKALATFKQWYAVAAEKLHLTIVVTIADYQGAESEAEPPSATVEAEDKELLKAFPGIAYLGAWNGPNLKAEECYVNAVGAGHYWNSANSACAAVNGCTAIAAEVHDEVEGTTWKSYLSGLKEGLSGTAQHLGHAFA